MWSSIVIPIITVILVNYWAWKILKWIWIDPRKKEKMLKLQGFNGNSYSLTNLLFGDVKENSIAYAEALGKPINVHSQIVPRVIPFVNKTIQQYGKKSFIWAGVRPQVLILDPDLIKIILNEYNKFVKNFKITNDILRSFVGGLISYEGDKWSKSRGKFNPIFYAGKLKKTVPAIQLSCDDTINEWKRMVSNSKEKEGPGSCVVDVVPYLESFSAKILCRALFDSDYSEDEKIFELLREIPLIALQTTKIVEFPGGKYLPTKENRKAKQMTREVREIFLKRIEEKAKAIKAGDTTGESFFDVLLEPELAEAHGMKNMDDIIGQLMLFHFAGHETSSMMLVWTMVLLSIHQNWQQRAREEVFQVFGDSKPDYEGLSQLKIVSVILNEVLRLYPPIVELSRLVEQETRLGEIVVPADTLLMLPTLMVHRDPEIWGEDANDFKPDRFADGVLKATKGKTAYFPFGWGPRVCIGQNLALLEGKLMLANILKTFLFELSPTYTHAPHAVSTLQPQYGAHIVLRELE